MHDRDIDDAVGERLVGPNRTAGAVSPSRAVGSRGRLEDGTRIADRDIDDAVNPRQAYLLHTMRCLWVRLEEMQSDLAAVGGALKLGIINSDMAAGMMAGAGILHLLDIEEYAGFETTFGTVLPDALSTTTQEHDDHAIIEGRPV